MDMPVNASLDILEHTVKQVLDPNAKHLQVPLVVSAIIFYEVIIYLNISKLIKFSVYCS